VGGDQADQTAAVREIGASVVARPHRADIHEAMVGARAFSQTVKGVETAELAPMWRAALTRAGADPRVGRKLPGALRAAGLEVTIDLLAASLPITPIASPCSKGWISSPRSGCSSSAPGAARGRCRPARRSCTCPISS
jgi:hypothetical protein